ncbi:MAG: glutamate formimidoyltransferase [Thermodesulfobacteriota bacterium]
MQLLECVPNISEGRDEDKIKIIVETITQYKGVKLLDFSSDRDHNRSVISFIGDPKAVQEAALSMALKAIELIDMRFHRGEHPRIGAVDVVPFVPILGIEMEEAVKIARAFGKELGKIGIPIYFYEEAAIRTERRDLPFIRKGEYEGLQKRLEDPYWEPDEGPAIFNPKSGATVVGARFPLLAYNINLKTKELEIAKEIARKVRFKDGGFPCVRALGVELKERGMVQVSMNLTNYRVTNLPKVYEFVKDEAKKKGVEIDGSEIIGLIPLGALEGVVQYYLRCSDFSIRQVIEQRILEFE